MTLTRDQLVGIAVEIAAETRLVELHPYATGMCASDLQRALGDLRDELAIDRAHGASRRCRGEGSRHGDRWVTRDGRTVVVASNDWPPPAKGTHESDLYRHGGYWLGLEYLVPAHQQNAGTEFWTARDWSRSK